MKRVVFVFLIFSFNYIYCQDKSIYSEGYIINNDNDTIYGLLNNQNGILIKFKQEDEIVKKFNPNMIKEYRINNNIYRSFRIVQELNNMFFKLVFHGNIDLYVNQSNLDYYFIDTITKEPVLIPQRKKDYISYLKDFFINNDSIIKSIYNNNSGCLDITDMEYFSVDFYDLVCNYCQPKNQPDTIVRRFITYNSCSYYLPKNWKFYEGEIVLVNGDTINGGIMFYETSFYGLVYNNYCLIVPKFNNLYSVVDLKINTKGIYFKDIKKLKILFDLNDQSNIDNLNEEVGRHRFPKTLLFSNNFEYVNLNGDNNLWRLIKKKDSVAIYDDNIIPINNYQKASRNMILKLSDKQINIYFFFGRFIRNNNTERLLVHFINKRYHKSFKEYDFIKIEDMFDYILENK